MSLFDEWFQAANKLDKFKIERFLYDDFVVARPSKGDKFNKQQFIDLMMSGYREDMTAHNRRLVYENDGIIVSHSIL